jgi:hypothetical protein
MHKLTFNAELELRHDLSIAIGSEALGWYLPTDSIDVWIAALEHSGFDTNYRLFVAPTSVRDVQASGLLYLLDLDRLHQHSSRSKVLRDAPHKLRVPLGAIGLVGTTSRLANTERSRDGELWLPTCGQLAPNLPPRDLLAATEGHSSGILVWLPSIGLIEFEVDDAIQYTQLLRRPAVDSNEKYRWRSLPDTPTLPDCIHGFLIPQPPPIDKLFEQEQKEIGGQSADLDKLAADGTSSGSGILSKAQAMYKRALENMLAKLAERKRKLDSERSSNKSSGKSSGYANLASKVSLQLMQRLAQTLQSQRDRQIEKLLNWMQKDPDKALKFAIPLAAMSAFRGLSLPTSRLTERMPNFNLGGLFGSGPADIWNINAKLQAQLQAAYRAQADRELAAGRFRRAAYIHANLLGDLSAAAAILEKGRHYDEASILYGEKLNRPRDQARCMAMAGRTAEAASLYIKLNDFEAAAKVWDDVDNKVAVREVYLKAIEQLKGQNKIVDAARLLDEKLNDRTSAEMLLWEQWPNGREVVACAEMGFQWMAESGLHEQAREMFAELVEKANAHPLQLATISAKLARNYPDRELRSIAEDRCRIAAVAKLPIVSDSELGLRLRQIEFANHCDPLLTRDSARFERIEASKYLPLQPTSMNPRTGTLLPLKSVKLPQSKGCIYRYGEMIDGELLAIVDDGRELFAMRIGALLDERSFDCIKVRITSNSSLRSSRIEIHKKKTTANELWLAIRFSHGISNDPIHVRLARLNLGASWTLLTAATEDACASGFGENGIYWSLSTNAEVLSAYHDGTPTTYPFMQQLDLVYKQWSAFFTTSELVLSEYDYDDSPLGTAQFKMVVNRNRPIVAADRMLVSLQHSKVVGLCTLDGFPNCMVNSPPHTSSRVAIGTEHSLSVLWLDRNNDVEIVARHDQFTLVTFMHNGRLMAATERELHCYQRSDRATTLRARVSLRKERTPNQKGPVKPVALLPLSTDVIGVLYEDGVIDRYRVS